MFCSKITRALVVARFVASFWPRALRMAPSKSFSCLSTLCFAAKLPSPQPPTASRKQSAKCCLFGLVKVGSSVVSPQQSHIRRQSSMSTGVPTAEFACVQKSGQL